MGDKLRMDRRVAILEAESACISKQNTLFTALRYGEEVQAVDWHPHPCFLWDTNPKRRGYMYTYWASLVAQMIKNLPAMWETQVWSLGQEDLLEKRMATHSSILARRIPWTKEPRGLQSTGLQRVRHNCGTNTTCTHIADSLCCTVEANTIF